MFQTPLFYRDYDILPEICGPSARVPQNSCQIPSERGSVLEKRIPDLFSDRFEHGLHGIGVSGRCVRNVDALRTCAAESAITSRECGRNAQSASEILRSLTSEASRGSIALESPVQQMDSRWLDEFLGTESSARVGLRWADYID